MKLAPSPLYFRGRIIFLGTVVVLGFLVVLGGYYRIQLLEKEHYESLGESYRIKRRPAKSTRGLIYDRNKVLITQNMPTYNLVLLRDEMNEPWRILAPKLSEFLAVPVEELERRYAKRSRLIFSAPISLAEDIGFNESLRIMRNQRRFSGLAIETAKKRFYTHGDLFAHALGYVGLATQRQLDKNPKLKLGDTVGRSGLELAYNDLLTGIDGERTIHIDHRGVYRRNYISRDPIPGHDLILSLDFDLQKLALDALDERAGCVLMMDVRTGELLVYVSSPSFDLNLFPTGISHANWNELNTSAKRPLFNRPVLGAYAPGSIFKLVTGLAALKHNKVTPATRYFCNGSLTLYNHTFRCHKETGHGWVNLTEAIQTSCNVFFWNVANNLNPDDLANMAFDLGFGKKTGVDLIGEKSGVVPNPAWKRKYFNKVWYPGDTLNVSIGQGDLQTTPLQLVQLMAGIANNGVLPRPHFLVATETKQGRKDIVPEFHKVDGVDDADFEMIKEAMWRVVNAQSGTGSNARLKGYDVCGKTGTAQLITFKGDQNDEDETDEVKNAWFAGFAPRKDPKVAIMVLVEHAGAGGANAAPIAQKILEAYFERVARMNPI